MATLKLADDWTLSTEHSASSYGIPVLLSPAGEAYGPADFMIDDDDIVWTAAQVAARAAEKAGLLEHAMLRAFLGAV